MKNLGPGWQVRGIQVACLLAVLAVWSFVTERQLVNALLLPSPRRVLLKFWDLLHTGDVYLNLAVTVWEFLAGSAIAAVAGLTLGYFIGRSRYGSVVFEPLLAGVFAVPIVIFLPIFLLFFGIGPGSKIAFGASYAFFPIILNTIGGVSQVDPRYVRVARAMGANDMKLFRRVLLPAALPVIITGLRIGFIVGFLAIIGGEMIAGLQGLGSQIARLGEAMNTADMFAYILFVVFLAMALNFGLSVFQNRFSPSREAQ